MWWKIILGVSGKIGNTDENCIYLTKKKMLLILLLQLQKKRLQENTMGGACSAYGGRERRVQVFGGET